uniref:UNC-50 family protein n=1 Tax=Oryza punctata TaxID=4537 RepID=A0A0E0LY78_ORYPU
MLPTTASKGRGAARSSPPLFGPYLRRIVKVRETKNQWARDDPAFVVILILFLVFATSAYCAAYGESASHAALTITSVVLVHFLFAGIVLATLCWLYAFDVHCNSFFPAFVILYVILIGFNPTRYFLSLYFR